MADEKTDSGVPSGVGVKAGQRTGGGLGWV
jgi:hypothetical protein